MKRIFIFAALLAAVAACGFRIVVTTADAQQKQTNTTPARAAKKSPVLVELFTSDGCPSCPPADANLAFLEREQPFAQAEIITIALHVDYWNSVGWKDEYSSAVFSRRQQLYSQALKLDSNYTPQMIVDGRAEFVGSSLGKVQRAILEAAKTPKAAIEITQSADKYKIKISDLPAAHEKATVFLAVTEDNLASSFKGGENSGKRPEHTSVVRELSSLGMVAAQQTTLEIETAVQMQTAWKRKNLKLVVFVQENASRKILGVSRISLS